MKLTNFTFDIDADGIATLTWDMKDRSMNVITVEVMDELDTIIEHVAGTEAIKGCVITSGKDSFSGGADLTMLQASAGEYAKLMKSKGEEAANIFLLDSSARLGKIYRRLETCGKPFAAAIHGTC
ncbi:MAG: enoyl-CoA hydratase-related protein, partial [Beijerinckiaceae bacterium]